MKTQLLATSFLAIHESLLYHRVAVRMREDSPEVSAREREEEEEEEKATKRLNHPGPS